MWRRERTLFLDWHLLCLHVHIYKLTNTQCRFRFYCYILELVVYRYFRVVLGGGRSGSRKESEMGEKRGLYYPAIFIYRSFNIRSKNLPVGRLNFCCFLGALNHIGTGHDNTLKVMAPSEGVRVTSWGSFSRQGLCRERRHWTCSWYRTESVYPTGCGLFFHYLVLGSSPGISHLLGRWWTCTAWWGEWLADAVVELATAVLPAFPPHWRCCGAGREWSEQLCVGPFQSWRCACWCGGPKTLKSQNSEEWAWKVSTQSWPHAQPPDQAARDLTPMRGIPTHSRKIRKEYMVLPWREAGDVWCPPPLVWNLRAVIWFHFTISSLVLLPSPITFSVLSFFCLLVHSPERFPENSSIFFVKT